MKKYFFKTLLIVSVIFTVLTFACKKPAPAAQQVMVGFHFHTFIGGNLIDPVAFSTEAYYDSATPPRLLSLQVAQFYVSNISIHLYGGTWMPITNDVILKRINNEIYPLGNITSGAMDSVRFTVGIGNGLNSQLSSNFSASNPLDSVLATELPFMYGSQMQGMADMPAQSGYTFMNIQGYDSTDNLPLNYQLGGYGDTVNVVLGYAGGFNFVPVLTGGQPNLIHIIADYGKLLQALQPINNTNNSSHFWGGTMTTEPVPASTLLNAIKNMFRWECDPPINC